MNKKWVLISLINSFLILAFFSGCQLLKKKVDPSQEYTTNSGFQFRFSMSGEWYPGATQNDMYMVGQKPTFDRTSKLAIVKHGSIDVTGTKNITNIEILNALKKNIENEANGGRVSNVKSNFAQKKYSGADCLIFDQSGEDNTPHGAMNMNNQGMICLHPNRPYYFIWMAISERWPLGKSGSASFEEDKRLFLNSLKFINQ